MIPKQKTAVPPAGFASPGPDGSSSKWYAAQANRRGLYFARVADIVGVKKEYYELSLRVATPGLLALAAALGAMACGDSGRLDPQAERGRQVYMSQCTQCHA